MNTVESVILNFVQRVSFESNELTACIAEIALINNEIANLFAIFHEQHTTNPDLFRKMMGEEVYLEYLEVLETV